MLTRKSALSVLVAILLFLSLSIPLTFLLPEGSSSTTTEFPCKMPAIYVEPENNTGLKLGDTFTVSVKIFNLTSETYDAVDDWMWGQPLPPSGAGRTFIFGNLYGLDIKFSWNTTILEYVDHVVTIPNGTYPGGYPGGVLNSPSDIVVKDDVNESGVPGAPAGTLYWLAIASRTPAEPFNNPGQSNNVFNMTFRVKHPGTCPLHFVKTKLTAKVEGGYISREIPHKVIDGYFGRDIEVVSVEVPGKTSQGWPVPIDVIVSNLGGGSENFTVSAYYNLTVIDWADVTPTVWAPIEPQNEQNVTDMPGTSFNYDLMRFEISSETLKFVWNTTGVLDDLGVEEAYFYIKVNATEVPDEEIIENNVNISEDPVLITTEIFRDLLIDDLNIVVVTAQGRQFPPPLVIGETAKISFSVLNNGTVTESGVNVTLSYVAPDGTIVKPKDWSWQNITQNPENRTSFEITWDSTGLKGNYTVVANVTEVPDENVTNNKMEWKPLWIVEPPELNVTLSKVGKLNVGDNVFFNATLSSHKMPGGEIIRWEWKVYNGSESEENLVYTYDGGPIMNYTFSEYSAEWPVTLNVSDNYGLFYWGKDRLPTRPYRWGPMTLWMEMPTEEEVGRPPIYTYGIILAVTIIIIVAAVYLLKVRKPKSEVT